tara:strand:+ start:11010 stop:11384 length:375 start_codon:yes stop_codon:yes gene_type:complete
VKYLTPLPLILTACASPWGRSAAAQGHSSFLATASDKAAAAAHDPVLSFVAAACLLAGVAALVVTRGQMGTRAVVVGLGLCILNYVLAYFAAWLFVPVLIATGAVSLAYAYATVRKLIRMRKAA